MSRSHAFAPGSITALLGVLFLGASFAAAGPLDPVRHAFERVGPSGNAPALAMQLPGSNRILTLSGAGELSLVTGDGLFFEPLGTVPVEDVCGTGGVFDATWAPGAEGSQLFFTYVSTTTRALTIGRLDLDLPGRSFSVTDIFDARAVATCERVGGTLDFAADGTLLLGVGDHGQPATAGSTASRLGKILRMTVEGFPPMAPLDPNPLNPNSPLYALGVRDPAGLVTDAQTGESWFLDRGGLDGVDELNRVAPLTNHGWNASLLTGYLDLAGDPHHVWDPTIDPTGAAMARGGILDDTLAGAVLVTTATGAVTSVTPDPADTRGSSEEPLFEPDAGGPGALSDPRGFEGGAVHVVGADGQTWRLRLRQGNTREPSRRPSVLPSVLRKTGPGAYLLSAERVSVGASFGLHVGELASLGGGYTHLEAPDQVLTAEPPSGDAMTRWALGDEELGGAGTSTYFLLGAFDGCAATGLGADSFELSRPGGLGTAGGAVPVLGGGTHDLSGVIVTEIAVGTDGLYLPRDLEFHPNVPGQLWVVNRQDDSTLIIHDAGRPTQTAQYEWAASGNHFLAQPSALAFGPGTGYFATSHEEDDFTQGPPPTGTPADFMGPTLWTDDASIYEGGHASHYDMLHHSPNGAGIAWESGSAYWIFDGWHSSLTRYDFREDHGLGGADHSDGIIDRYADGQVAYVPDVPSHLVWDHATDVLIIADTGNNRIATFDPSTAVPGGGIGPNYDGCTMQGMSGGSVSTLIDGAAFGLVAPSGLELHDCKIFVTDNATSTIYAFSRDGRLLDWLDTGWPAGTLMGMAFDPATGELYLVDALTDRVLRLSPR